MFGLNSIRLKPSQIRFTQNSTFYKFYRHSETLNQNVNEFGSLRSPDNYPTMTVVIKDRKLYSLDNRRLYLFRVLEQKGIIKDVPVTIRAYNSLDSRKFTTTNDGNTITFSNTRRQPTTECTPLYHGVGYFPDITAMDFNESTRKEIQSVLEKIEREKKEAEERSRRITNLFQIVGAGINGNEVITTSNVEDSVVSSDSDENSSDEKLVDGASLTSTETSSVEDSEVSLDSDENNSDENGNGVNDTKLEDGESSMSAETDNMQPECNAPWVGADSAVTTASDCVTSEDNSDSDGDEKAEDNSQVFQARGVTESILAVGEESKGENNVKNEITEDSVEESDLVQISTSANATSSLRMVTKETIVLSERESTNHDDTNAEMLQELPRGTEPSHITPPELKISLTSEELEVQTSFTFLKYGGEKKTFTHLVKRKYDLDPIESDDPNNEKRSKMDKGEEPVIPNSSNDSVDSESVLVVDRDRLVTAKSCDNADAKQSTAAELLGSSENNIEE